MGFFNKMKEPVFLKDSSDLCEQLEKLRALEPELDENGQEKIQQDMKYLEYGIQGENTISYELKNSHMPMYILHDIYLEDGELSAQIDYLVITRKLCFVLECKNLYGDIEINNSGDFIRTTEFGGRKKKEGIYSPVTQNQRHLELIKKIKTERQKNLLKKIMVEKYFNDFYRAVVVLANPKTVLNARYAKKEIKENVIRADQLIAYIKEQCRNSKEAENSDEQMLTWAQSFLELHKETEKDYTDRYQKYRKPAEASVEVIQESESDGEQKVEESTYRCRDMEAADMGSRPQMIKVDSAEDKKKENTTADSDLFQELRAYRLKKSREEGIKPYYLYNDSQLKDLMAKMPESTEEMLKVSGFGPVKTEKYGADILQILSKYRGH